MFKELAEKKTSLKEAAVQCADIKASKKVQDALLKGTKCQTWVDFSSKELPKPFKFFCNEAIARRSSEKSQRPSTESQVCLFHVAYGSTNVLFLKKEMASIEPTSFCDQLDGLDCNFKPNHGFALAVLDYALETIAPEEETTVIKNVCTYMYM